MSEIIKLDKGDYICNDCAREHGGTWPPQHVATMHMDICPYCNKLKGLANIGDWNWPDGIARGMWD